MTFNRTPSQPASEVLDMGFPHLYELNFHHSPDPMKSPLNCLAVNRPASTSAKEIPPQDSPLDMCFDALLVQHEHPDQMPLDMGFGMHPVDHAPPAQHEHPDQMPLDMGFGMHPVDHAPLAQHEHPDQMSLDMGFGMHPVDHAPLAQHEHLDQMSLDMGFGINPVDHLPDQSVDLEPEDRPLDMGFGIHPVHDFPDQSLDNRLDDMHLDMGFETLDPVHVLPDHSVGGPEPIGFVIQRAVQDLCLAIHWLEMERNHGTMSPEEVSVSWEVLQSTNELLLSFQLISIYRLST
ncbi:uncharacterized protein F5147DRAFT_768397 [Suillus discolor]|uniref:Uncharacterized protein n=1 Tax=Suillus discolor TaxID=1912936 RepID=A0A9P7JYY0_9AGAM|nr:uncharacterized protein F5147DRAFT_768397 [Suillus discolor]KAG2117007.1 hypothetical protein F5147DRAFT_768397 [Suillus discolor]